MCTPMHFGGVAIDRWPITKSAPGYYPSGGKGPAASLAEMAQGAELSVLFDDGCVVVNDVEYWCASDAWRRAYRAHSRRVPPNTDVSKVGTLVTFLEQQEGLRGKGKVVPYSAKKRKIVTNSVRLLTGARCSRPPRPRPPWLPTWCLSRRVQRRRRRRTPCLHSPTHKRQRMLTAPSASRASNAYGYSLSDHCISRACFRSAGIVPPSRSAGSVSPIRRDRFCAPLRRWMRWPPALRAMPRL